MSRVYDDLGREIEITGFGQDSLGRFFVYNYVSKYEIPDGLIGYYETLDKDKFTVMNF